MNENSRFTLLPVLLIAIAVLISISCKPDPGQLQGGDFVEADTVYYCDLLIFMGENDGEKKIVVCEFEREKTNELYSGRFWGCMLDEGRWTKLSKSGKYRLLSSRPSIPEGPPGVTVRTRDHKFLIEYSSNDQNFELKTDKLQVYFRPSKSDNLMEHYATGKGELKIGDMKIKGRVCYGFNRWVGYMPITTKYSKRYKDLNRFFLYNNDVFLVARENSADLGSFITDYNLPEVPKPIIADIKAGRKTRSFENYKKVITDRMFDLALFRIPYGWEIEFDEKSSLVLAGEGYYLDNKVLTGRAIIDVSGVLNVNGHDYELTGICEFIK